MTPECNTVVRALRVAGVAGAVAFVSSCTGGDSPRLTTRNDAGLFDAGPADAGLFAAGDASLDDPAEAGTADSGVGVAPARLRFTEVAARRGLDLVHAYDPTTLQAFFDAAPGFLDDLAKMVGGLAASDVDRDGWVDVFVVGGDPTRDRLFQNRTGAFEDVTRAFGVETSGFVSGPSFADLNADGFVDLVLGGIWQSGPTDDLQNGVRILQSQRGLRFVEATQSAGVRSRAEVVGTGIGDPDADGDLDLLLVRWGRLYESDEDREPLFWRNIGDGSFEAAPEQLRYPGLENDDGLYEYGLVANFADLDDDGFAEALIASDFGTTSAYRNVLAGAGRGFEPMSREVFTDENAMSTSLGDVDGDLDLDWFMTNISADTAFGYALKTGNRLYENRGGQFVDGTERSGLRHGSWGWASCMADFDNDGHLDVFHVNGYGYESPETERTAPEFGSDRSRLFLNDGTGRFRDVAASVGIDDPFQGRATACFDYDRDGDVDIFVMNVAAPVLLYENQLDPGSAPTSALDAGAVDAAINADTTSDLNYLNVRLRYLEHNRDAIGARIYVTSLGATQMREIRIENNYVSQGPPEAHFGLAAATRIDELRVVWPRNGSGSRRETRLVSVAANQQLIVEFEP